MVLITNTVFSEIIPKFTGEYLTQCKSRVHHANTSLVVTEKQLFSNKPLTPATRSLNERSFNVWRIIAVSSSERGSRCANDNVQWCSYTSAGCIPCDSHDASERLLNSSEQSLQVWFASALQTAQAITIDWLISRLIEMRNLINTKKTRFLAFKPASAFFICVMQVIHLLKRSMLS